MNALIGQVGIRTNFAHWRYLHSLIIPLSSLTHANPVLSLASFRGEHSLSRRPAHLNADSNPARFPSRHGIERWSVPLAISVPGTFSVSTLISVSSLKLLADGGALGPLMHSLPVNHLIRHMDFSKCVEPEYRGMRKLELPLFVGSRSTIATNLIAESKTAFQARRSWISLLY